MTMPGDGVEVDEQIVFIVDDDEGVRAALEMLVRSIGMRFASYSCGADFLAEYDGRADGCVLLDVRMPGMTGFEVRQRLQAMGAKIPVIFLTAHSEEELPARIGPVERIQKPFRDEVLVRRIRQLVGVPLDD